jgi:UMF1 family MFS transporter
VSRLAERLCLHRPELRAWALYDWANSPFLTVMVSAVFPIFFYKVAAAGMEGAAATSRFTIASSISLAAIAILSPLLGAVADRAPVKKRMLAVFMVIGASATAATALVGEGMWVLALALFGLGQIGATGSFVFYDSLLPHVAREDEVDRVSTAGYAFGYVGGGIVLGVVIALSLGLGGIGTRAGFVLVAVWWLLFAVPLFRRVPEPPVTVRARGGAVAELRVTFRELRRYPQALLFLTAFLLYNDGIGTIIKLAAIYGTEIGLEATPMIVAILLTQFIGIPATFAFGQVAGRIGTKPAIFAALAVYCVVSVLGYFMTTVTHFYLLAVLVGLVQGGAQALSRSLFSSMIPKERSSEMFALFGVFEKFAGIAGPGLFALTLWLTGSSRDAILSVIVFFVAGGLLLWRVDVDAGRRAVRTLAMVALIGVAGACGGAPCAKWDQASTRIERARTDEQRALDAELQRRGLTVVQPQVMREVQGAGVQPWGAVMTPPREGIDVDLPTLVSVGDPRPVVVDAEGRFFTVVVTGKEVREEVVLCGCDPGRGTEQFIPEPSTPYLHVLMKSLDDYRGDVEIRVERRVVTTRYERTTGKPGE